MHFLPQFSAALNLELRDRDFTASWAVGGPVLKLY